MAKLFFKLMSKVTAVLDPHLEKYRPPQVEPEPEIFMPENKKELIALLRACDQSVLSDRERRLIAGVMAFPVMPVRGLMHAKKELTYLQEDDKLDPLTLDRLYKTGEKSFPVKNAEGKISGLLHLGKLDALKVTEDLVSQHMQDELCFVRGDYSYEMALAAFLRTGNSFALVVDRREKIIGYLDLADLMNCLLSVAESESFCSDTSIAAVAKRTKK